MNNTTQSYPMEITCDMVADYCYMEFENLDEKEDCFLSLCFEPRSMKSAHLYPITVIYCLIFAIGVIGNAITCMVMTTTNKQSPSSTSRYLVNLAVSDLINLLSGVPFEIYLAWNQYPWHPPEFTCHLKAWILETTSYVSVLTILAFSVERYLAVCDSFGTNSGVVKYRKSVLFGLWILAGLCAIPYGYYHKVDYVLDSWPSRPEYGPVRMSKMCMFALAFDPSYKITFEILFHATATAFFFVPLIFLVVLYWRMAIAIKGSRRDIRRFSEGSKRSLTIEYSNINVTGVDVGQEYIRRISAHHIYSRKTFYMLAAVVISFFFCYAPYQLHRLLFFYVDDSSPQQIFSTYFYFVSGVMFYMSSVINPILYSLLSLRFRAALTRVIRRAMSIKRNAIDADHLYVVVPKRLAKSASPSIGTAQL